MKDKKIWAYIIPATWLFILLLAACGVVTKPTTENLTYILPTEEILSEDEAPIITEENKMNSETEIDLSAYFEEFSGTAVFLSQKGDYRVYNPAASELRLSPCSTFKIISTLAAFEYGVVTPESSLMEWDGTYWPIESWNRDLTIDEAFRSSCVWYYRRLTDGIGKENMAEFLEKLNYGNCDVSLWEGSDQNGNAAIDGFWLDSSLEISPREQVGVIGRIFEGETDINENNIVALKAMMLEEGEIGGSKIYGKTGTGKLAGWYVGFFEKEDVRTYFALCLNEQDTAGGTKAREIAVKIINSLNNEQK